MASTEIKLCITAEWDALEGLDAPENVQLVLHSGVIIRGQVPITTPLPPN